MRQVKVEKGTFYRAVTFRIILPSCLIQTVESGDEAFNHLEDPFCMG
jgi:hypothetical protein